MNNVTLVGRLTKDTELRYSQANEPLAILQFTLAVDRRFKKDEADFISCKAFGKTAEFIDKYFSKGMRIGVVGRIQTGSYNNKDGQKVYTTDVVVDAAEFVESKQAEPQRPSNSGFVNIPEGIDEELPFT